MIIRCTAFPNGGEIPQQYTCDGRNVNPPLTLRDIPDSAVSLVLVVSDEDARPQPWIHWLLFNIPADTRHIPEAGIPPGAIEGLANDNRTGFRGPCPKYFSGAHRYRFRVMALSRILSLPPTSDTYDVIADSHRLVIAQADYWGTVLGRLNP